MVFELDRPESFGLKRGLGRVLAAREALAGGPAEGVSLADLIQAIPPPPSRNEQLFSHPQRLWDAPVMPATLTGPLSALARV